MATNNYSSITDNMLAAAKSLGLFAVVSSTIVALAFLVTEQKIKDNERLFLLKTLHNFVSSDQHDNDLYADKISSDIPMLNFRNKPVTIYRARLNNKPVASIFEVTAPDGYNGAIKMLIAVNYNYTIAGVRVISHKETPGLGDGIEIEKSDWITKFNQRSLSQPKEKMWLVKKDGGVFDQLTGATITPRAIVKMTKKVLVYYSLHRSEVFVENGGQ